MRQAKYTEETVICERRNQLTGFLVRLEYHPAEEDKWVTICDEHGSCVGHSTRKVGTAFVSVPWEWCEDCRELPKVQQYLGVYDGSENMC